jgi:hypothetical protein
MQAFHLILSETADKVTGVLGYVGRKMVSIEMGLNELPARGWHARVEIAFDTMI